jgi:7-cyano-7-deazaguanine synthase
MSRISTVLLSGGIDSAACARYLQENGNHVRCIFVDYRQAAVDSESWSAAELSKLLKTELLRVTFDPNKSWGPGEILGRNAFLILAALMTRPESGVIALGIHSGTTYYDCTPAFLETIDRLVAEYTDGCIRVTAPFISWSKKRVFDYYVQTGLPLQIAYSCEAGTVPPCGGCASCRDRRTLLCSP